MQQPSEQGVPARGQQEAALALPQEEEPPSARLQREVASGEQAAVREEVQVQGGVLALEQVQAQAPELPQALPERASAEDSFLMHQQEADVRLIIKEYICNRKNRRFSRIACAKSPSSV